MGGWRGLVAAFDRFFICFDAQVAEIFELFSSGDLRIVCVVEKFDDFFGCEFICVDSAVRKSRLHNVHSLNDVLFEVFEFFVAFFDF